MYKIDITSASGSTIVRIFEETRWEVYCSAFERARYIEGRNIFPHGSLRLVPGHGETITEFVEKMEAEAFTCWPDGNM